MGVRLVWAQSPDGVIGRDDTLPWSVPEDLARFRTLTRGHAVVMGRATWESLPVRYRPLPDRQNVVLSRTGGYRAPGAVVVDGLEQALASATGRDVWVVGGGEVYAQALPYAEVVERTVVDVVVEGDAWAPALDPDVWELVATDPVAGWATSRDGLRYRFETWRRREDGDGTPS